MSADSERHSEFFVKARSWRLLATDISFSGSCELSQPVGQIEFSSTAKKTRKEMCP